MTRCRSRPSRSSNIPGLNVETSSVRQYNTTLAAHILGTIGKMDGTDWETYESKGYAMDAYIGKDGLEQAFEEELHGSDGTRVTTITADGNILEEHYAVDPVAGNNIETTIDLGLQKVAEESLAAKILSLRENGVGVSGNGKDAEGGAVVVMKVKTGEVLACASYPTYDLSTYNTNYNELAADPYKPFNNRALGLPYPPGSTYKMVTTIAAIDSGTISRWTEIEDEGVYTRFEDAGYMPRCMLYTTTGATHGLINVMKALAVSCNYYFYEAGYRTGHHCHRQQPAKALGPRRATGIELPEATGRRANPETKKELYDEGHDGWYDADTVAASIGQSENRFTPLQLCSYTAALANRGVRYTATLLKRVLSSDYQKLIRENQPVVASTLNISDEPMPPILRHARAVTSGTAYSAFVAMTWPSAPRPARPSTAPAARTTPRSCSMPRRTTRRSPLRSMWKRARRRNARHHRPRYSDGLLLRSRLHGYRPRRKYPELKSRRAARRPAFRLWRALPNCHCEGASRPWQSREGTVSPYTPL